MTVDHMSNGMILPIGLLPIMKKPMPFEPATGPRGNGGPDMKTFVLCEHYTYVRRQQRGELIDIDTDLVQIRQHSNHRFTGDDLTVRDTISSRRTHRACQLRNDLRACKNDARPRTPYRQKLPSSQCARRHGGNGKDGTGYRTREYTVRRIIGIDLQRVDLCPWPESRDVGKEPTRQNRRTY